MRSLMLATFAIINFYCAYLNWKIIISKRYIRGAGLVTAFCIFGMLHAFLQIVSQ